MTLQTMDSLMNDSQSSNGHHNRIIPGSDMVQDMVEHGFKEVPLAFIQPPHERALLQGRTQTTCLPLPVIDIAMLQVDGPWQDRVLAQTIRAFEEWAFSGRFYALSAADKEEFRTREGVGVGYGRYFESAGAPKDWVDSLVLLTINKDASEEAYDVVLNKYQAGSHQVFKRYGHAVHELARKILTIFSEGLGQSPDFFCNKFAGEAAPVRTSLNYYPPCPHPELVMGCSGHTDVSSLAILQQSDVSRLQVLKDEFQVPVSPIPHAFVVNIGDILQILSIDQLKSMSHRAIAHPGGCFSISNFFQPRQDTLQSFAAD